MENNQKEIILLKDLGNLKPTEKSNYVKKYGLFKCYCGNEFKAVISSVNRKNTKSCGCLKIQTNIQNGYNSAKHGLGSNRIYDVWHKMIQRCENKDIKQYSTYGKRGISVCNEWKNISNFYNWALNNGYNKNLTIDRINNDGNYEPSNCRWIPRTQNCIKKGKYKNNSTGYTGIYKDNNKYFSYISVSKKRIWLGTFNNIEDAILKRNNYIIENKLEHTIIK